MRIPKTVAQEVRSGEGDVVEAPEQDGATVIRAARPVYSLDALVEKITPHNRHGETDWGSPRGGEQW